MDMRPLIRLALPVLAAVLLVACDRSAPPEPSPAAPPATASLVVTAAASPSAPPSPVVTASATPSGTPTPLPPAGPTPPAGYAASCASAAAWGRQVTKPFVCIDEPKAGATVSRGGTLIVRGYAGGSFEHNVVVEVRAVDGAGHLAATPLFLKPLTYSAPDIGMPGAWQMVVPVPPAAPAGLACVIAHFESPRDGSRVAEAAVDVTVR